MQIDRIYVFKNKMVGEWKEFCFEKEQERERIKDDRDMRALLILSVILVILGFILIVAMIIGLLVKSNVIDTDQSVATIARWSLMNV